MDMGYIPNYHKSPTRKFCFSKNGFLQKWAFTSVEQTNRCQPYLIGGLNPPEKYESQIGSSPQLLGKIHVPNHQPVIKVEFPMIFHKTMFTIWCQAYDQPFGFQKKHVFPSWTSQKKYLASPCEYRATIFCTATNSVTIYLTLKHV